MKKLIKGSRKRTYFGYDADGLSEITYTLCQLEDGIDMTEKEEEALDIAIQAITSMRNAMISNGKIRWDEA